MCPCFPCAPTRHVLFRNGKGAMLRAATRGGLTVIKPIRMLRLALQSPKALNDAKASKRVSNKRIVTRASRGNIRLQRGEYATAEELEERYERVKSFNFEER